jgi:hypothetical protein
MQRAYGIGFVVCEKLEFMARHHHFAKVTECGL